MASGRIRDLFTANDMTQGTPWRSIARFAFPMLVGNFAQQLYNTVDAVVVGRSRWGYTALASVGNALPVLNLLLALFVGIATGAGILVAQFYGAKDRSSLEKTIGNCIFICFTASVVIMVAGPVLTTPMLRAMNTLPEMFDACRDYLNIFFLGILRCVSVRTPCSSSSSAPGSMWRATFFWSIRWASQGSLLRR